MAWLNLSVPLPCRAGLLLELCRLQSFPSPAHHRLAVSLCPLCRDLTEKLPPLCGCGSPVLLPPKTWPWAHCQPRMRLSCSVQCGSCLRFHFPLASPWPACFLLPTMPHLFSRRPHFSLLQTFRTQRLTRFPALPCASIWSSVLHTEPLSTENNQADCILLDYFQKKTKAVSQAKSTFPCLIWTSLEN